MEFKEYILKQEFDEQCRLFEQCDAINHDWMMDESLWDMAKGAWNTAAGVARAGAGAMTIGDEAIAKAMGQGTKGRMGRGWGNLAGGVRQTFVGSPNKSRKEDDGSVVVGGEKFSPEEMQQWRDARSQLKRPEQQPAPTQQPKATPQVPQQPTQAQATAQQAAPRKKSKESLEWEELVSQYRASKDRGEKNRIQATMAMSYPRRYKAALDRATEMQARNRAGQQTRVQAT